MADEQQAIDFLTNTAKDAAKGLAEESEVYRIAENIVEDNKALFGTVNTILNKELGISFDVGKDKEIGFTATPDRMNVGFKMKFDEGGTLQKYQSQGFVGQQFQNDMPLLEAVQKRIDYLEGAKPKSGEIRKLKLVKVRLEGGIRTGTGIKGSEKVYESLLKVHFPGRDISTIMVSEVSSQEGMEALLETAQKFDWYKGQPGAAWEFQKILGESAPKGLKNWKLTKTNPLIVQGSKTFGLDVAPELTKKTYQDAFEVVSGITNQGFANKAGTVQRGADMRRFAKLMLVTGLRETDIARLQWKDVDLDGLQLTLRSEKGAQVRTVKISQSTATILQKHLKHNNRTWTAGQRLFNLGRGDAVKDAAYVSKEINALFDGIKIMDRGVTRKVTLEDFRHAMANRILQHTGDVNMVSALLGHKPKGITGKYTVGAIPITSQDIPGKITPSDVVKMVEKDHFSIVYDNDSKKAKAFLEGTLSFKKLEDIKEEVGSALTQGTNRPLDKGNFIGSQGTQAQLGAGAGAGSDVIETQTRKIKTATDIAKDWGVKGLKTAVIGIGAHTVSGGIKTAKALTMLTPDPTDIALVGYETKKYLEKKKLGDTYDSYMLAKELQKNYKQIEREDEKEKKLAEGVIPLELNQIAQQKREDLKARNNEIYDQFKTWGITPDQAIRAGEQNIKIVEERTAMDWEKKQRAVAEQISQLPGFSDIESTDTYDVDERGLNIFKKQERETAQL